MYYNRYAAPDGTPYQGANDYATMSEAEAAAKAALKDALPGTQYRGTSLTAFRQVRHAA